MSASHSVSIMKALPSRLPVEMVNRILEYTECNAKIRIVNINTPRVQYIGHIASWNPYSAVSTLYASIKYCVKIIPVDSTTGVDFWYELSTKRWYFRGVCYKSPDKESYQYFQCSYCSSFAKIDGNLVSGSCSVTGYACSKIE
jgi:hypothetical protein